MNSINTCSYSTNNIPDNLANYVFFEDKDLLGTKIKIIKIIQKQKSKNKELKQENDRLEVKNEKLEKLAYYDELTGLYNRRGLKKHIKENFENGEHITVISIDIKNLKVINDYYGNISGDKAIKKTSELLKQYFNFNNNNNDKNRDIICRHGGDEFLIILKKIDKEKINKKIEYIISNVDYLNKEKKYDYGLHIGVINDYTIDDYQIANEKGLTKAKGQMKEIKNK